MQKTTTTAQFADLKLDPRITTVLSRKSITAPTPIQNQAIPVALDGNDLLGIAQTGTGKTLGFVIPIIQHLLTNPDGQAWILVPTRELAYQVDEVCQWFSKTLRIYSTVVVGGASMRAQLAQIKRKPHFIIATPGRLLDHLQQKTVDGSQVKYLILDEADRMFDMGFAPQIKNILQYVPAKEQRQTLLFSATMPASIAKLVAQYMRTPVRVEIAPTPETKVDIQQEMIIVDLAHQKTALFELLKQVKGTVLIFTRTKYKAKTIVRDLRNQKYRAEEIHSNRSLAQRRAALAAVQSKRSQILVATDIAARGIDISHIDTVINFDLPGTPEEYVHRIGRTGRAGRKGRAISFVISDQGSELRDIQQYIKAELQALELETVPTAQLQQSKSSKGPARNYRGGSRGSFSGNRGRSSQGGARKYQGNRKFSKSRTSR